jgi:hypothetical protein
MQIIQTVTVGSGGAANITFSSIPQTFTDLYLVISGRLSSANSEGLFIEFNGVTSGYSSRDLYGTGSSAATSTNPFGITSKMFVGSQASTAQTSNTFGVTSAYIPNYTASITKAVSAENVYENNATAAGIDLLANLWTGTGAITSIVITSNNGNLVQYSSASLFGIKSGSDGIVTVS